MDGLYRSLPMPVLFPVGAGLCPVAPLTLGVLSSCEAFLMSKRCTPADQVDSLGRRGKFDGETLSRMRERALSEMRADRASRCVSGEELFRWLYTAEGIAHSAYWCLKGSARPEFRDPAAAADFVGRADAEWVFAFVRVRDLVSGTDALANLDWKEEDKAGAGRRRFYPWRRLIRFLALEYRFPPEMIAGMTLYTLKAYTCEEPELGGTKTLSAAELKERGVPRPPKGRPGGGDQ